MELLPHPVPDRTKYDLLVKDTNTEQFATDCFVFFCKKKRENEKSVEYII